LRSRRRVQMTRAMATVDDLMRPLRGSQQTRDRFCGVIFEAAHPRTN
jgi:hypothetical protein